jgi:hypothetical protein
MSCACAVAAYLGFVFLEGVPQTIHFEQVAWNSSAPTEIYSVSGIRANSADGSQATWAHRRTLGFLANEEHVGRSIYTRSPHTAYLLDDEERTVPETWPIAQTFAILRKEVRDVLRQLFATAFPFPVIPDPMLS